MTERARGHSLNALLMLYMAEHTSMLMGRILQIKKLRNTFTLHLGP